VAAVRLVAVNRVLRDAIVREFGVPPEQVRAAANEIDVEQVSPGRSDHSRREDMPDELLTHDQDDLLVAPRDPVALATTLEWLGVEPPPARAEDP
jgi:hypothetical protein